MIFSHSCVLTVGCFTLILLDVIQTKLIADTLNNVESAVGGGVNYITTGSPKAAKVCGMNTVNNNLIFWVKIYVIVF